MILDALLKCMSCGHSFPNRGSSLKCPACGSGYGDTSSTVPDMEVKDKGDALAQPTTEDQQETVQEDLQASAGEAGPESIQDALLEKGQEKAEEIAKDKTKEVVKEVNDVDGGKVKGTPKSGVRVRKASTTCFHYPNCFNFFCWYSC